VKLLQKKDLDAYVFDSLYTKPEIEAMKLKFINPDKADVIFDTVKLKIVQR
jgi:hypothetical protein